MVVFGFSSGLPFALTGGTLQAWMTVSAVNLRTMGIFSAIGLPYALKFLWSPLMDRFTVPWLGRRRGWIICMQVLLLAAIVAMAFASPEHALGLLAFLAFSVAFLSASQDIVIDAYRTDLLQEAERGAGTAVYVTGYRIAMLVSGAGALILSDRVGWRNTYLVMAFVMVVGMIGTFVGPEPDGAWRAPRTLRQAVWGPLKDFLSRNHAIAILVFIVFYKLGDAYASSLTTAFLIGGMGFSRSDVGEVNKAFGMVSVIVGAGIGGSLMVRLGLFRALLYFGILQAVSILSFSALALVGKSYSMLVFAVGFENLTGGMGTSAFVAFLMGLCDHRYSATQFALLSSLAVLGRVLISLSSGFAVELMGWPNFFLLATLSALPGLAVLWFIRDASIFKR